MTKSLEPTCPAARLASEAAILADAWACADATGEGGPLEEIEDRLQLIEETAAHVRATSSLGAFFQALILRGELDEGAGDARAVRRLRRLACSIAGQLETSSANAETVERLRSFYFKRENDDLARLERVSHAA